MSVSEANKTELKKDNKLFLQYSWFYENIFERIKDTLQDFFQLDYKLRFMGVSFNDENVFFTGDEYFVNKVELNQFANVFIRISSNIIMSVLDNSLGSSDRPFSIDSLTDVETELIKEYNKFIYNKLEGLFIKTEPNKKVLKNSKIYNFTFFIQFNNEHLGKMIISLPDFVINDNIEIDFRYDNFDINRFRKIPVQVDLRVGATRISLNEIKNIENGDVIMLEESDVNQMGLLWEGNVVDFNITPNPALIISVDSDGGEEMSDEEVTNSENMWDTILVDVTAEFDNFKLTLGELKQISEGLVIDVGSVYENKVKLKVAKQVVASGELVILNDRYGVRIDTVNNGSDESSEEYDGNEYYDEQDGAEYSEDGQYDESAIQEEGEVPQEGDENFNYSDFEIEDESI